MFKEMTIQDFCQEVGDKTPTPGGGSVAALSAALSQSLLQMVTQLSEKDNPKSFHTLQEELIQYPEDFLTMMDDDAAAFNEVMAAFKMDKKNKKKKKERRDAIQLGFTKATFIPFNLMKDCCLLLSLALILIKEGNQNALSDSGVGALMAGAALKGARYNVLINLPSLENEKIREGYHALMKKLYQEGSALLSQIEDEMEKALLYKEE